MLSICADFGDSACSGLRPAASGALIGRHSAAVSIGTSNSQWLFASFEFFHHTPANMLDEVEIKYSGGVHRIVAEFATIEDGENCIARARNASDQLEERIRKYEAEPVAG